jgi:hypothetical protein
MATLLLELAMTRIFSVVFYYHFAFLAISIALFGLGAGGVFSYVIAGQKGRLFHKLGTMSLVNAAMPLISVIFILTRGKELTDMTLAAVYFFSALPFFVAGAIVSLAISETIERIDSVYFFDLLGAAAGCLLLMPLLNSFGGPNTVIASAVLFAVGSAIWYNLDGQRHWRAAAVAVALALVALIVLNAKQHWIDVKVAKGQELGDELYVRWNSFSRIAVSKEKNSGQLQIVIDADASTGIVDFSVDSMSDGLRHSLLTQGPGFPYSLRPGAKTLIIGPGGGWDVARAIASGAKDITGVEINPIIANNVMRRDFAAISRNLYSRPGVRIHVEDGRSFVRRSEERYDVLQATLVDTWASTAAGAFALSENNLYTTEAFVDYLSHLTDKGILAITRWGFEPPRESVRLLVLAREALARLGEREPWMHVMVVREGSQRELEGWGARDTVIISRKPFSEADRTRAEEIIARGGLQRVYLAGDGNRNAFGQVLLAKNLEDWLDAYPFDVSAVGDNRPFFFYTVQPRDLWAFLTSMNKDSADYKINRAVPMLFSLIGVSLLATLIILALPPFVLGTRLPREKGVLRFLMYFLCIGVGYILIQVALIQKFVLFLGHPTYALTVIIFSMLVSSGLGSSLSRRWVGSQDRRLIQVLAAVAALVAILAFVSAPLTGALTGLPLPLKMLITVALIAPAGFFMGMPFPQGLARLEEFHKPSVRWAWSINAASSVLGSAAAIFLAIYLGLRETLLLGGVLYVGALLVLKATSHIRQHHVA